MWGLLVVGVGERYVDMWFLWFLFVRFFVGFLFWGWVLCLRLCMFFGFKMSFCLVWRVMRLFFLFVWIIMGYCWFFCYFFFGGSVGVLGL